jgi:hypothetical protein
MGCEDIDLINDKQSKIKLHYSYPSLNHTVNISIEPVVEPSSCHT